MVGILKNGYPLSGRISGILSDSAFLREKMSVKLNLKYYNIFLITVSLIKVLSLRFFCFLLTKKNYPAG